MPYVFPVCHCSCLSGTAFTCTNALVISADGSNVRFDAGPITLTGGASLGTCTPTATFANKTSNGAIGPSPASIGSSITCDITNPTLQQSDIEAGTVSWNVTVGDVQAKGHNTSVDGAYTVTLTKALPQVRKYQLGIKRVPVAAEALASVVTAGELSLWWWWWGAQGWMLGRSG